MTAGQRRLLDRPAMGRLDHFAYDRFAIVNCWDCF
jgi:hypothetical protein